MDTSSPTLRELLAFLGGVAIAIPSYVKAYREWKTSRKVEAKTDAEIELTQESARSLRIRDDLATGEGVGRMLGNLIEMGDKLKELPQMSFELEQAKTRLKLAQHFNKKLKALLDFHEIPFSEADQIVMSAEKEEHEDDWLPLKEKGQPHD